MVFILLVEGLLANGHVCCSLSIQVNGYGGTHQIGAVCIYRESHQSPALFADLYGIMSGNVVMHIAQGQLRIGTLQPQRVIFERNLQDDVVHLPNTGKVR